ncbi:MAG: DNA polymerase III subunit beta [Clostridia bacterium]|nr:DNA polymerase III subunit beta [Clostridia bacterium]
MKFTVSRDSFLEAVSKLSRVVGSKSTMPVLEGILISAEQGRITLVAYNLETGMKKEIYCNCEKEGDIVIKARLLSDILRKLSGAQVEIEVDEKLMCHIKSDDTSYDIMGMAAGDFPEMPSVADGEKIEIDGKTLCDMVKGTIFAVSQIEGSRPIYTGINISTSGGVIQFVAIDGYRLAIRKEKTDIKKDVNFVVPGKAINEVVKIAEEENENVEIIIGARLISFLVGGYSFIARLFEGEYVDFKKVLPEEFKQAVTVNKNELVNSVERVSLLINDAFSTPIRLLLDESEATLSCATSIGKSKETFSINLSGSPFEIGLNSRYLLDALKACDDGNINIKFNGPNAAVTIEPEDEKDDSFLYLIMPLRLK